MSVLTGCVQGKHTAASIPLLGCAAVLLTPERPQQVNSHDGQTALLQGPAGIVLLLLPPPPPLLLLS
jgi:hypothetical protein